MTLRYKNSSACEFEVSAQQRRRHGLKSEGCSWIQDFFFRAGGDPWLPSAWPGLWLSLCSSSGISRALMLRCARMHTRGSLYPEGPQRVYLCKWQEPICCSPGDVCVPGCRCVEKAALCPLSAVWQSTAVRDNCSVLQL